ncbi:MAG: addiction module protein [bacterium]|nr:addiction module protein [bacterium]
MINKDLQGRALQLSALDKIHLVEMILESLDKPDPEIMEKWVDESEKRYQAFKDGKTTSIPYDTVMKRLEEIED